MKVKEILYERPLAPIDLVKHIPSGNRTRLDNFINKMEQGEEFELDDGSLVVLKKDKKLLQTLKNADAHTARAVLSKLTLITVDGEPLRFTRLKKTKDFGGEPKEKRLQHELSTTSTIDKQIKDAVKQNKGKPISVKVGNRIVDNVVGAAKVPGTPKADLVLLGPTNVTDEDEDTNTNTREVAWISVKKGSKPTQFLQWAGVTAPPISDHLEVLEFQKDCQSFMKRYMKKHNLDKFPRQMVLARHIKSEHLKLMAVYGDDYSKKGPRGPQNIDLVAQGDVELIKEKDKYKIKGSAHMNSHGEVPEDLYEPLFLVRYAGDRRNFDIPGARVMLAPAGHRTVTKWL